MTPACATDKVTFVNRSRYGNWQVVTALTPLRWRWWARWLHLVFAFGSRTNILVGALIKMRVIALGRWTLIDQAGRPPALVFETNWAGFTASYIPDFAMIMPVQWIGIWGATKDFPGPLPATRLLEFVDSHNHLADHFHTGYRDGTTTESVVRALELDRRLERFLTATDGLPPLAFAKRWDRFLVDVQELL
jgi:hypothetical protein